MTPQTVRNTELLCPTPIGRCNETLLSNGVVMNGNAQRIASTVPSAASTLSANLAVNNIAGATEASTDSNSAIVCGTTAAAAAVAGLMATSSITSASSY
ncbi:unnamed protein product [Anisakis simplex]|uniref:Uncharacterized protein n=1 Tax=Anisakis simplex TaxID=6269 RepID=A0A0M3JJT8_ANISI|nr:unnamed protein product [Anisakis simplex]